MIMYIKKVKRHYKLLELTIEFSKVVGYKGHFSLENYLFTKMVVGCILVGLGFGVPTIVYRRDNLPMPIKVVIHIAKRGSNTNKRRNGRKTGKRRIALKRKRAMKSQSSMR